MFALPTVRTEISEGLLEQQPTYKQMPGSVTITTTGDHTILQFFGDMPMSLVSAPHPPPEWGYIMASCRFMAGNRILGGGQEVFFPNEVGKVLQVPFGGTEAVRAGTHHIHMACLATHSGVVADQGHFLVFALG